MRYVSTLALLIAAPAAAQEATPPTAAPVQEAEAAAEEADAEEIVVTGSRQQPGAVIGDIPPDQQLNPADIRSYGVSSVADLLAELGPQTRSGRGGPPIVLLNGRRISGFQEIRDLPTEAILRVDILPEEVALRYGYRADSRVINFVLRRRFRAVALEADDTVATEGGRHAPEVEADLVAIQRNDRASLHLEVRRETALLESERDIRAEATDDGAATFDQRPFRTLLPEASVFEANAVFARPLLGASASLNGQLEVRSTDGRFGLPVVTLPGEIVRRLEDGFLPLAQRADTINARLGSTVNGNVGEWRWTLTGSYDRNERETLTETGVDASGFTGNPLGILDPGLFGVLPANRARSVESTGQTDLLVNGSPFSLPAGEVSTSVRAGARTTDFTSRSFRNGVTFPSEVERDVGNASVNVDLPIAGREALNALGDLSVNVNLGLEELSDFGSLVTIGYGLNWRPVDGVRLLASMTEEDNAPSEQQLGAAVVTTPNVRVFDFTRGETATVTTITGGNPFLAGSDRRVRRLGLTLKPWEETDLDLTANYTNARVDDPTVGFPAATAAIEAAFPDRFGRDVDGRLISLDTRPINFARTEREELRWGINFSRPLRSRVQRELEAFRAGKGPNPFAGVRGRGGPGGGGRQGGGGGGGRGFGGGGGRGGFGGGGQGGGRLQFALYHNWRFTDRVLVADGGPLLDLLDGDAIGSTGGSPRHELEGQAGYTNNGLGARLSVNWRSATRVSGLTTADDLRFGDLGTADLRLFADLGNRPDWVRRHPWMRGVRITASVDNLLNQRQRVTDATGLTPVSLQPDYLDPLGRSVRVSVRKLFF